MIPDEYNRDSKTKAERSNRVQYAGSNSEVGRQDHSGWRGGYGQYRQPTTKPSRTDDNSPPAHPGHFHHFTSTGAREPPRSCTSLSLPDLSTHHKPTGYPLPRGARFPCRVTTPPTSSARWQQFWETNKTFRTPDPATRRTSRSSTSSTCSPTPAAPACTSATPRATPRPTSSAATSGCAASTSCTRWAGTPSACPPSSTPSRPARHPRDHDPEEHRHLPPPDQDRSASATTGTARSTPPTRTTSSGRSGSSCSSTTPGTTPIAEEGPADRANCRSREVPSRRATPTVRRYQDSKRLAYQAEVPVNWCPALGTVLANEEVIDGKSERGGHPVVRHAAAAVDAAHHRLCRAPARRPGAARLARVDQGDAAQLDRPERRGRGRFPTLAERRRAATTIRVFTTRPDTLFGATYMVLAPEHPLVDADHDARAARRRSRRISEAAARKSDLERTELAKTKTGVFTGATPINPVNERADPDLDRRLRADELRHRRDHGRARPRRARLRVRHDSSACRSSASSQPPTSG